MFKINKLLLLVFFVLFFSTLIEGAYLIYLKYIHPRQQISTDNTSGEKNTATESPETASITKSDLTVSGDLIKAVNPDVIDTLSRTITTADLATSNKIYVTYEFNSIVEDIALDGMSNSGRFFPFAIKLKDGGWYYANQTKKDATKVRIINSDGQSQNNVAFSAIKNGDKILIREVFDASKKLSDNSGLISIDYQIYR